MTSAALTFGGGASTTSRPARQAASISIGAPRIAPGLELRLARLRQHRVRIFALDAAIIIAAAGATATLQSASTSITGWHAAAGATAMTITWITAMVFFTRSFYRHSVAAEPTLMPAVRSSTFAITGIAVMAGLTGWPVLQAHLFATLPAALLIIAAVRFVRQARRAYGHGVDVAPRTIVFGSEAEVAQLIRTLTGHRRSHNIVGVVLNEPAQSPLELDGTRYAVLGASSDLVAIARQTCAETVMVAQASDDPDFFRRLSWSLEGAATSLVLVTPLTDVAPSRMRFERSNGHALTHVSLARFDRTTMHAKRALDVTVATLALVPIALLTPVIAALIVLDAPGGVFFRQRRIGHDGREFEMLKFRTMCSTAEVDLAELVALNEGSGPLFKLKNDPRVTRVGSVLRRYSLDELPQFWNVLRGDMSVVGPRPPLAGEVRDYESSALRRLYVQPGITGLWQVSGRSDLSWEQSIRLDLHYVENWSVATDLRIMCRTAAAMVRPKGAY
ncbi:sugar transferase (plasmid) [Coraliomargarita sp. W4R53]